jgi:hypothetical protein
MSNYKGEMTMKDFALQYSIGLRKEVRRLVDIIEAQDPDCTGNCDRETWRRMAELGKKADAAYRALSANDKLLYGAWDMATLSEDSKKALFGITGVRS